jgi:hypothetical protein
MRAPEPRRVVLCPCGEQWFGTWTIDNPAIADHRGRCGEPIGVRAFLALGHVVKWPPWWDFPERKRAAASAASAAEAEG